MAYRPFAKYAEVLYALIKSGKQPDPTRQSLGMIGFPPAAETPPLQAADLLAYLTGEHMKRSANGPVLPEPELEALLRNTRMPEDHTFLNEQTFRHSIADVLPIAPGLAFEREDEDELRA